MTASVQVLFVGTQGQTPTDRVPAAPVQSGLSAILRHRKEVHGLQPHRHFPHLTTDSFDRRRLHKWKLLRLTLLLLAVSILRRLRRQHDPTGREISAPKTWSYDVEVNCGRLVSCRLRSLVFFFVHYRIRLRPGTRVEFAFTPSQERARPWSLFYLPVNS